MLRELFERGARHVAGCQYAGITLADKTKAVTNVVATHRYPMDLDAIQNQCGEGPCLSAVWRHQVMHVEDLNVDRRWPQYQRHALEQTPIRSILSYELFVDNTSMSALNFFANQPPRCGRGVRIAVAAIAKIQHQADRDRQRADRQRTSAETPTPDRARRVAAFRPARGGYAPRT